jgi:hypothetical protein
MVIINSKEELNGILRQIKCIEVSKEGMPQHIPIEKEYTLKSCPNFTYSTLYTMSVQFKILFPYKKTILLDVTVSSEIGDDKFYQFSSTVTSRVLWSHLVNLGFEL